MGFKIGDYVIYQPSWSFSEGKVCKVIEVFKNTHVRVLTKSNFKMTVRPDYLHPYPQAETRLWRIIHGY